MNSVASLSHLIEGVNIFVVILMMTLVVRSKRNELQWRSFGSIYKSDVVTRVVVVWQSVAVYGPLASPPKSEIYFLFWFM